MSAAIYPPQIIDVKMWFFTGQFYRLNTGPIAAELETIPANNKKITFNHFFTVNKLMNIESKNYIT